MAAQALEVVDVDGKPDAIQHGELTVKQSRFVIEYLRDGNATQAAIRAGYSEHSAAEIGYENLRKPQIVEKLEEHWQYALDSAEVTAQRIVAALWENHSTAVRDNKRGDSNKALELLGKHHKMFTDKFEHGAALPPARLVVEFSDKQAPDA